MSEKDDDAARAALFGDVDARLANKPNPYATTGGKSSGSSGSSGPSGGAAAAPKAAASAAGAAARAREPEGGKKKDKAEADLEELLKGGSEEAAQAIRDRERKASKRNLLRTDSGAEPERKEPKAMVEGEVRAGAAGRGAGRARGGSECWGVRGARRSSTLTLPTWT
jgi:hypothetical protein